MHRLIDLFPFPFSGNYNYSISLHVVYVVCIHPHVLCHLGLIFVLANAFSFFTQKQFQAHERETGYMFRESVISFNPFKTDENTEANNCPKQQVRSDISASGCVSSFNYCTHCHSSQGFTSYHTFLLKIINLSKDK